MDHDYQLNICNNECYLHADLKGEIVSPEDIIQIYKTMADNCKSHNQNKLLHETDITTEWSFHSIEKIANQVTKFGFDSIYCAILLSNLKRQFNLDFGANIANDRGSHFSVFFKKEDALSWLKSV